MVERWTHAPGATRGSHSVITFPSFSSSSSSSLFLSTSFATPPPLLSYRNAHVCCTRRGARGMGDGAPCFRSPSIQICVWVQSMLIPDRRPLCIRFCTCTYACRCVGAVHAHETNRGSWSCTTRSRVPLCQPHICVIVPAGSIRPNVLSDMRLSYRFVQNRARFLQRGSWCSRATEILRLEKRRNHIALI